LRARFTQRKHVSGARKKGAGMLTRLLICGVLGLMIAVQANAAPVALHAPVIEITVFPNGSLQVEGHRYATVDAAKTEILAIGRRKPRPEITFVTVGDIHFYTIGRAIQILQATGVPKIGFLTEPENTKKQTH
jgi:biopolymer transport protein ExbD